MSRVAIFVDGETLGPVRADQILAASARYGRIDMARAYCGDARAHGWRDVAGFRTMTAEAEEDAELSLAMDAIETALVAGFETFVLASHNPVFAPLAQRLREHGLQVVGLAGARAPQKLRASCSEFCSLAAGGEVVTSGTVTPLRPPRGEFSVT